ncbi:MAG TPA: histidine kinase, partial [Pyrinomonadaceae bacterium]|nr:histidine kinase [Pyrinomonadaceae bacterium]
LFFLRNKFAKWTAIWGLWTLLALFFASQVSLQSQLSENPTPFWRVLAWQLASGYVWFAISPIILWLGNAFPFDNGKWKTSVPIHLVASIVIAIGQLSIDAYLLPKLGYMQRYADASYFQIFKIFLLVNVHFGVAIYWGVLGFQQAIKYYQKYRERELKTSQLEARLAQSRLQVLKMQLHPHFLFNTLNAISELIHRDADTADRMITDLSDLLRMSFESLEVQEVPLKQELEFLRKYLEIEQTRFHDRLKIEMDIAPDTLDASVPNMILQPLVENAIKHGISPRATGGRIDIEAIRHNGHLQITVKDDGLGITGDVADISEGVGLSNTKRRLKHLYGEDHQFDFQSNLDGGVKVNLKIPYREAN